MPMMGEHGRGGITPRSDGRLQVALTMPNGRRAYRMIPKMDDRKRQKRLAEDALRQLVDAREADLDPAGQTLAVFLRSWLASMTSATHVRIRPNTLAFYTIIAEKHVIPVLGDYKLDRLSERHVQSWLDGLRVSPQYVSHCRAFLRRVLNVAYRQRIITRNPAIAVELPPIPEYRANTMTADEVHRLLDATRDDRLAALWRLAAVTGLRVGELCALSWDDVDVAAATVTVRTRLAREDGEWVRVAPKADRDLERIAIDEETAAVLDAHRVRQAAERTPEWRYWGLLFTTPAGNPLDRHAVLAAFRLACDKAGIARRRVHDIRHSNATILRDLAVDKDIRKARLGQSSDRMADRYGKASERQDRAAVEKLAAAIR
jgi:integrase